MKTQTIKVWDPIVRLGHWTLVIAFFTAYFTEDEWMTQHVWAGYIVGAVVLFRIVWGIIGSQHARFSDFIYKPSAIFGYLIGLAKRKAQHYVGHNPAGGAMVIALLLSMFFHRIQAAPCMRWKNMLGHWQISSVSKYPFHHPSLLAQWPVNQMTKK